MNIFKKRTNQKSFTKLERKSYLSIKSKDFYTIDSVESQGLDAFCVEGSFGNYIMQRMGQIIILASIKKPYRHLRFYKNQSRLMFRGEHKVLQTSVRKVDHFLIKPKEKPENIMERPLDFKIDQKPRKKIFIQEQSNNFMLDRKQKPPLKTENVNNVMIEKEKRPDNRIESLNKIKLPAAGKFFNNMPVLKIGESLEFQYLKIKPPFVCENPLKFLIPFKPKKVRYTDLDVKSESSSNLLYIINKVKLFSPTSTKFKNESSLLIPPQPKKTSFTEITTQKVTDVLYDIPRKITPFEKVVVESIPDLFIQEQPKKRYFSAEVADHMSIIGSARAVFCLEIDPNEEIFIENVYDMLLIQNVWDDLSITKDRLCLRPPGYKGKSSRNLPYYTNLNLGIIEEKENEEVNENKDKENNENKQEKEKDKDNKLNENNKEDNNTEIKNNNNDNINEGDNKDKDNVKDKKANYIITINYVETATDNKENKENKVDDKK